MLKKIFSLIHYLGWLDKRRHDARHPGIVFRLADIKNNRLGEKVLLVQLVNKAITFLCKPIEILKYDHLLEGFSKNDVRTISYLAAQEVFQPKYQIISQHFNASLKKIIFKLQRRGSKHFQNKTAAQISRNKSLLNNLHQADAHRVGYVNAIEQAILEKEFIEKMNQ